MQIESSYPKFTGRVPPLDLTQVNGGNSDCRTESELHHHHHNHENNLWSTKSELMNSPTRAAIRAAAAAAAANIGLNHPYHRNNHAAHTNSNNNNNNDFNHNKNNLNILMMNSNGNSNHSSNFQQTSLHQIGSDGLPLDPRDWTRADVWKWLINMAVSEGLEVTPELPQKFPMNGKALCLMSLDMYLCRVPVGGKMLYRDFRVRLARAMASLS